MQGEACVGSDGARGWRPPSPPSEEEAAGEVAGQGWRPSSPSEDEAAGEAAEHGHGWRPSSPSGDEAAEEAGVLALPAGHGLLPEDLRPDLHGHGLLPEDLVPVGSNSSVDEMLSRVSASVRSAWHAVFPVQVAEAVVPVVAEEEAAVPMIADRLEEVAVPMIAAAPLADGGAHGFEDKAALAVEQTAAVLAVNAQHAGVLDEAWGQCSGGRPLPFKLSLNLLVFCTVCFGPSRWPPQGQFKLIITSCESCPHTFRLALASSATTSSRRRGPWASWWRLSCWAFTGRKLVNCSRQGRVVPCWRRGATSRIWSGRCAKESFALVARPSSGPRR